MLSNKQKSWNKTAYSSIQFSRLLRMYGTNAVNNKVFKTSAHWHAQNGKFVFWVRRLTAPEQEWGVLFWSNIGQSWPTCLVLQNFRSFAKLWYIVLYVCAIVKNYSARNSWFWVVFTVSLYVQCSWYGSRTFIECR